MTDNELPPIGSTWMHTETEQVYVVMLHARGKKLGGEWDDGVVYGAGGSAYWTDLARFAESFEPVP